MPDWLVADIGGTHARFALSASGGPPRAVEVFACADFDNLTAALAAYLTRSGALPVQACVAVAGPVNASPAGTDEFRFTNNAWVLSRAQLAATFGFEQLLLVNDFEALALALPELAADDTCLLGSAVHPVAGRPLAVLGPGTGLGVATLVHTGTHWLALAGEGGHVGFAPQDAEQRDIAAILRRSAPQISNEMLLSGPGLCAIYAALTEIDGAAAVTRNAPDIIAAALSGVDARARHTIDVFLAVLGAVAGDVALLVGAQGGVYIGGGIVPRLLPFLAGSRFRRCFDAKGVQSAYVSAIPTRLILTPTAALVGAVVALKAAAAMV